MKDVLRSNGWLRQTPGHFQDKVIEHGKLCRFDAGEQIYRVGDPPGGMYGLIDGGLAVAVANGERISDFAHFAGRGSWFGEAATFTGEPRRVGLRCTRPSSLLHLSLGSINHIVSDNPEAWRWFALVSQGHLDMAVTAAQDLMIRDPSKRCMATLLRLAGLRLEGQTKEHSKVDVTQSQVAELANLSRNAAGAILRELERQSLVKLAYKSMEVLQPEELRLRLKE